VRTILLKKIQLVNFQNHTDSAFDLSDGLTVLRGSSDSGKTAVVRAIKWVLFNRPLGDSLKRWGADFVKVVLEFDDCIITREKSKKLNGYYLLKDGVEKSFNVIKSDVPQEVIDALGLLPENIQTQFDSYFLLQDSPGAVAAKLNEAADMEVIGEITKEAASLKRDIDNTVSIIESKIVEVNSQLISLSGTRILERMRNRFLSNKVVFDKNLNLYDRVNEIIDSIKNCIEKLSGLPADLLDDVIVNFEKKHFDFSKEEDLYDAGREILDSVKDCNNKLSKLPADLSDDEIVNFEQKYATFIKGKDRIYVRINWITGMLEEYGDCSLNIKESSKGIYRIIEQARPIFSKMTTCILCHSDIQKNQNENLFERWIEE